MSQDGQGKNGQDEVKDEAQSDAQDDGSAHDLIDQLHKDVDTIVDIHAVVSYRDGSTGVYKSTCTAARTAMAIVYLQYNLFKDIDPTSKPNYMKPPVLGGHRGARDN